MIISTGHSCIIVIVNTLSAGTGSDYWRLFNKNWIWRSTGVWILMTGSYSFRRKQDVVLEHGAVPGDVMAMMASTGSHVVRLVSEVGWQNWGWSRGRMIAMTHQAINDWIPGIFQTTGGWNFERRRCGRLLLRLWGHMIFPHDFIVWNLKKKIREIIFSWNEILIYIYLSWWVKTIMNPFLLNYWKSLKDEAVEDHRQVFSWRPWEK